MSFHHRLDQAIIEAMEGGMLDAASRVETSKQEQRAKVVARAADQAVSALEDIKRVLRSPDYRGNVSFDGLIMQLDNIVAGLGENGNMRRSMTSLLTLPPETPASK